VDPKILFEDEYLVALDKPSGMDVEALQAWIKEKLNFPISNSFELRNGLVHRLDKPTSGVILVAKNKESFEALQKQFADRTVRKTYIALAHGKVKDEKGSIIEKVGRLPWKRTKFGVFEGGRDAQTDYEVVKYVGNFTLLNLFPKTGRTHQIRVHLKHIGHPVVADNLYAGRKVNRQDRKWCPRLFLHASQIEFMHPVTREKIIVKSELPEDLKTSLFSQAPLP